MPKRRRGAVDDSDESDFEDVSSTSNSDDDQKKNHKVDLSPKEESPDGSAFHDRRNRLRKMTEARPPSNDEDEKEDGEPMQWPVVLKTQRQPRQRSVNREIDDDEYTGLSSSEEENSNSSEEDEEFEYSDGGFVVDSDDNIVPANRLTNGTRRRRRGRPGGQSQSGRPRGRPPGRRGRPRKQKRSDDEDDEAHIESDDEFTASDASIEEELRELRGNNSSARRSRNYRARAPVDYTIPPPPTIEEVARATAQAAESAAQAKARDPRLRRLFDVRGPFGGKDVHSLFSISKSELEVVVKSKPKKGAIVAAANFVPGLVPEAPASAGGGANADIDPVDVTEDVDFSMVGGLDSYIAKLKEMISLPLLYPELYEKFGITPPRGVLFHGPPGTGKTLMARALAASHKQQKVTFYMRKGADVLSKWIGESERQLRALFDEARANQPSIIFFDEIDGLAPVRSAKQEQHHASIVSTLLALMDGMDNRGQVVIIGATNRPDSVDPALRRPGRFDREFYFPLPDFEARCRILEIHTQKWQPKLSSEFVKSIAQQTKGYGGADLRALTTESALLAIQRAYPQIYSSSEKLMLDPATITVRPQDFLLALERIQPSTARASGVSLSQPLPARIEPLLRETMAMISTKIRAVFPINSRDAQLAALFLDDSQFQQAREVKTIAQGRVHRPRLLIQSASGNGQGYLSRAIANMLEGVYVRELSLSAIFGAAAIQPESAIVNAVSEARQRAPSCILLPSLSEWAGTPHLEQLLFGLLKSLLPSEQVFVVGSDDSGIESSMVAEEPTSQWAIASRSLGTLLKSYFDPDVVHIRINTSPPVLSEFFKPVLEFIKRSPVECLDAQEMPKPEPPKLPQAPKPEPENQTNDKAESDEGAETAKSGIFTDAERSELRIRSQLKLKLGVILDGFRQRYRRFRKPVIDEQKLAHLFEYATPPKEKFRPVSETESKPEEAKEAQGLSAQADGNTDVTKMEVDNADGETNEPATKPERNGEVASQEDKVQTTTNDDAAAATSEDGDEDDEPYVLTADNMILEQGSGKRYYNMDLETVEDRLWNGFYCEPQQFLEDMEMIYKDAHETGERERIHKASEMLANAQVAIDDISVDKRFIAACQELHAKDAQTRLQEMDAAKNNSKSDVESSKETAPLVKSVDQPPKDTADSTQVLEHSPAKEQRSHALSLNDLMSPTPVVPQSPQVDQAPFTAVPQVSRTQRLVHYDSSFYETFTRSLVTSAQSLSLEQLEQLYAALSDIAWQHRHDWDRTVMIAAMDKHLRAFVQ